MEPLKRSSLKWIVAAPPSFTMRIMHNKTLSPCAITVATAARRRPLESRDKDEIQDHIHHGRKDQIIQWMDTVPTARMMFMQMLYMMTVETPAK